MGGRARGRNGLVQHTDITYTQLQTDTYIQYMHTDSVIRLYLCYVDSLRTVWRKTLFTWGIRPSDNCSSNIVPCFLCCPVGFWLLNVKTHKKCGNISLLADINLFEQLLLAVVISVYLYVWFAVNRCHGIYYTLDNAWPI